MPKIPDNGDMIGTCMKCGDTSVRLFYYAPTKEWLDKYCIALRKRAVQVAKKIKYTNREQAVWDELHSLPDDPV